jgi:hypothetical protein
MGCHTTVGTSIDQTFSFARKVTGKSGWGYIDLKGMADAKSRLASAHKSGTPQPPAASKKGEIFEYLKRVGGGSEFRANPEMVQRWFLEGGKVDEAKVAEADVYTLITPSAERARLLNKAYRVIVREQSFDRGRDATVTPIQNVYQKVDPEAAPPLQAESRFFGYDIRLAWEDD